MQSCSCKVTREFLAKKRQSVTGFIEWNLKQLYFTESGRYVIRIWPSISAGTKFVAILENTGIPKRRTFKRDVIRVHRTPGQNTGCGNWVENGEIKLEKRKIRRTSQVLAVERHSLRSISSKFSWPTLSIVRTPTISRYV